MIEVGGKEGWGDHWVCGMMRSGGGVNEWDEKKVGLVSGCWWDEG